MDDFEGHIEPETEPETTQEIADAMADPNAHGDVIDTARSLDKAEADRTRWPYLVR